MIIFTERLCLRAHRQEDLDRLYQWENDSSLLALSSESLEGTSREELRKFIEVDSQGGRPGFEYYAIDQCTTGEFIGYCAIALIDMANKRANLSIVIGEPSCRRTGFGKEAVRALIDRCFYGLALNRVGAEVFEFNEAAWRMLEGLGFRREGVIRENIQREKPYDEFIYGLLRAEWNLEPAAD